MGTLTVGLGLFGIGITGCAEANSVENYFLRHYPSVELKGFP